jgi:ribosome-binding factor A
MVGSVMRDPASGHRHARLEQLLLDELRSILTDEAADPALQQVRLLSVKLSADYRHARCRFTLADSSERLATEKALGRATSFLRSRLADMVELKHSPELRFVFEPEAWLEPDVD